MIQDEFAPSNLKETLTKMAEITGVDIPPHEYGENDEEPPKPTEPIPSVADM